MKMETRNAQKHKTCYLKFVGYYLGVEVWSGVRKFSYIPTKDGYQNLKIEVEATKVAYASAIKAAVAVFYSDEEEYLKSKKLN